MRHTVPLAPESAAVSTTKFITPGACGTPTKSSTPTTDFCNAGLVPRHHAHEHHNGSHVENSSMANIPSRGAGDFLS